MPASRRSSSRDRGNVFVDEPTASEARRRSLQKTREAAELAARRAAEQAAYPLVGFFRLRPGLTTAQLDAAETMIAAAIADYRKGAGGAGFFEVRVPPDAEGLV